MSMLARRLTTTLQTMTLAEILDTSRIDRIAASPATARRWSQHRRRVWRLARGAALPLAKLGTHSRPSNRRQTCDLWRESANGYGERNPVQR
jgi:hypothetical protein